MSNSTLYAIGSHSDIKRDVYVVYDPNNVESCIALDYLFYSQHFLGYVRVFPVDFIYEIAKFDRKTEVIVLGVNPDRCKILYERFFQFTFYSLGRITGMFDGRMKLYVSKSTDDVVNLFETFPRSPENGLVYLYKHNKEAFIQFFKEFKTTKSVNIFYDHDTIVKNVMVTRTAKL